ncbi:MAG: hypothetical protein LH624_09915 [Cryobacterium sp.]|nr:hypothetical protein [Cryobacterium sp.]
MSRKLLIIPAILAMTLAFAPSVSAAFYKGCTTPAFPTISPTWHVLRDVSGRQYNYAQGTTTLKNLHSCSPSNGHDQFSAVMVANLQDYGSCFMQIGYAAFDGTMYYVASSDTLGTGNITTMSLGFSPTAGDTATFSIFKVTVSGTNYWELRVTTSIGGTYGYRLISRSGCTETFPETWYGIETHNYADQFGGPDNPNLVAVHDLGYKYVGGPAATTWLQGNTGSNGGFWANGSAIPTCWHPGVSQDSGTLYTRLYGYTDNFC